jgi:outer membrane protein OmpA-like peptidoglycan-associated protein
MKFNNFLSTSSLTAALLLPFLLPTTAQAVALSQDNKIEGVIVSRDGDSFVVRGDLGATNVILTKSTKIDKLKGLIGVRSDDISAAALVPGLRVSVEPESPGKQTTAAKSIQFHADDLETANEIQAALTVPQQQILALIAKVNAQEKELATQKEAQEQQMAALKTDIDTRFADADVRFNNLDQYDVQAELNVLFDRNSANLSNKSKEELKAFADKAKTYKGYLVQVAGFTDSTGNEKINQELSDQRAASVANYLRQSCDLGMSRVLATVAMSSSKANGTSEAEGNASDRRVTVKIAVNRGIANSKASN